MRPNSLVQDPSAWLASDFKINPEAFIHRLSATEISELKAAVAATLQQGAQQEVHFSHLTMVTPPDSNWSEAVL